MHAISATEFKARCLQILDEVARSGQVVRILKRGRPVAELHPPAERGRRYPQETLKGSVETLGDLLSPAAPAEEWDAESGDAP